MLVLYYLSSPYLVSFSKIHTSELYTYLLSSIHMYSIAQRLPKVPYSRHLSRCSQKVMWYLWCLYAIEALASYRRIGLFQCYWQGFCCSWRLSSDLISARPYGELAILYRKSIAHLFQVCDLVDTRLLAVKVEIKAIRPDCASKHTPAIWITE